MKERKWVKNLPLLIIEILVLVVTIAILVITLRVTGKDGIEKVNVDEEKIVIN